MIEVSDVRHEMRVCVHLAVPGCEGTGRREDEIRGRGGSAILLGDEGFAPRIGRLLGIVVDAVVRDEHTETESCPRRGRVVEPGDLRRGQPVRESRNAPSRDEVVQAVGDSVLLAPREDIECLGGADSLRYRFDAEQPASHREAVSPERPQHMRADEATGLDEEHAMAAIGGPTHDLLPIRRQIDGPVLRREAHDRERRDASLPGRVRIAPLGQGVGHARSFEECLTSG